MDTELLIEDLVNELRPTGWLDNPMHRAAIAVAILATLSVGLLIGLARPDSVMALQAPIRITEIGVAILTAILSIFAAFSMCLPVRSIVLPVSVAASAIAWAALLLYEMQPSLLTGGWGTLDFRPAWQCLVLLAGIAIAVMAFLISGLRNSWPIAEVRASVFIAVAAGLIADVLFRLLLFHSSQRVPETITEQGVTTLVLVIGFAVLGRGLFSMPRHLR